GGDFAAAFADNASLRYNTTDKSYSGTTVSIGSVNYAFTDLPAATDLMVLSARGLTVEVGDFVRLTGNVAFQRMAGNIEAVATNFAAIVRAGSGLYAGVSGGAGALLLNADGTRQLFASGDFVLSGGNLGQVKGRASVAQNTAGSPVNQRTVSVDGTTVVVPQMTAGQQSVSAKTGFTIQDFFSISGSVSIEKSREDLMIAGSSTPISVEMLKIGGSDLNAFAGIATPGADAIGLSLTGVRFGVMLASPFNTQGGQDQRTWTAATATAEIAELLGISEITAAGTSLTVSLNQAAGTLHGSPVTAVADFSGQPLPIPTGGNSPVVLDHAGKLLEVSGRLSLTVSQFLHAEGTFAIRKSVGALSIGTDSTATAVDLLTIGVSDVSAFAGVNGGKNNAMGLALGNVDLGIAVATSQTDSSLQWTALKATVGNIGVVGINGLTASASGLSVNINRAARNGQIVDFSRTPLTIPIGSVSDITLNYAAADGPMLRATGTLDLDLFGFVSLSGSFAMQKSSDQLVLADGNSTVQDVDLLTIGGRNINAFAGVNGGSSDRMGLALSNVEFGLAMATSKADPTRQWTALSATAGGVEIVGIPNVTLSAEDLTLSINQPDSQGKVLDFSQKMLFVKTGTALLDDDTVDTGVTLDFEGSRGAVLEAAGTLTLGVGEFFNVSGSLAVTKSSKILTLSDASSVTTNLLTIAGSGINAFAGVNYNTNSAVGLSLTNTQFALALATDSRNNSRKWTTLQAKVGSAALTGLTGVTLSSSNLSVLINRQAVDETLVNYSAIPLELPTGQNTSLTLDVNSDLGPVLRAAGSLTVSLFDFFSVSGSFAVDKRRETVTLSDATTVAADLLTLGGANITAFAGLRDPATSTNTLGFALGKADFGLALITDRKSPTRKWTTLQATAELAEFVGGTQFEVAGTNLSVAINKGVLSKDPGIPAASANTTYRLQIANDTVGALTFTYQPSTGAPVSGTATIARADSDTAVRTKITTALAGLPGIGSDNVTVTGSRQQGFTIEFTGSLQKQNLSGLTVSSPGQSAGSVTVSQMAAAKVGVSEVQTITINASQPPAPTITSTVTQLSNGTPGSSHVQELVINKPSVPTPSVSALVTEITDGYTSTTQIRQLTINKPAQTSPAVTTSVTETTRGVSASSEIQQITIQKQDPPKPVIRSTVEEVTPGKGGTSSIVYFQFYNGTTGGSYTLSYGDRKKTVNWSTSDPTNIGRKLREGLQYVTRKSEVTVKFVQTSTISQPRFKVQIPGFSGTVLAGSSVEYNFGGSSGGTNEVQRITIEHGGATGNFRLGLPNNGTTTWTGDLSLAAPAAAIQTALNSLLTPGTVLVERTDHDNRFILNVTFTGSLAAQNLQPLQVLATADTPAARGAFTLAFNGQIATDIKLNGNTDQQASDIQTALSSLSTIGAGNVQVNYDAASTASAPRFNVAFTGSFAGVDTLPITASGIALAYASIQTRTVTPGTPAINERQTVTLNSGAASGTFRLSVSVNGRNYTTTDLAFNATASSIQTALNAALGSAGTTTVVRPGTSGPNTFDVMFAGALAGKDLPLLKIYTDVDTPVAGGTFSLSYGGQTSAPISLVGSNSAQASLIQQALQALTTVGAENISVKYDNSSTNEDTAPRFLLTSGSISVENISGNGSSLTNGASLSLAN
ncbi:MAG: beta strand repeat-containing protein, partial [Planctomycetaceae bacterium]